METKKKIVAHLEGHQNRWVSGEELSHKLGISRAAVSKAVGGLRVKGYRIQATPGKGYLLEQSPDHFSATTLAPVLKSSLFAQETMHFYDQTTSTNIIAKQMAEANSAEGTLVCAQMQTQGKGRKGRSWMASTGENILASLILRPALPPDKVSGITLLTAVAAAEAIIECTGLAITIKWPNDILCNGKKLAGILTEMSMEMDAVDYVITGIGMNVNTSRESMPEALKPIATSLMIETGETQSRATVFAAFLMRFEHHYDKINQYGFASVIKTWKKLSDFIGKKVSVSVVGGKIEGVVADITNEGILLITDSHQKVHEVISGDVTIESTR